MLSEKQIELINKVAAIDTHKYTGELITQGVGLPADIDYKFRITGHKKMMSVGEYYDYLLLEVTITGVHDPLSKLIFTPEPTDTGKAVARMFESRLYTFYSSLNKDIQDYMKYFNNTGEIIRTTIDDLRIDLKNIQESFKINLGNSNNLSKFVSILESQMSRISKIAVRTTVKDILKVIKSNGEGVVYLPGDIGEEYSFTNLPFKYSVELTLKINDELDGFKMDGSFIPDEDVIEIIVEYNPNTLKRNFYNIIGELNDIVSHELEHGFQYFRGEHTYQDPPSESFDYYTQPHEIKAQRVGFRRVAKLRRLPFNDVVRNWYEDHKDIHGLTDDEMEEVIKIILNGK